ncbi:hypothetical protein ACSXC4_14905 (plasmid) [Clostridium perfringens]|uniref:Uncharacterized protein n=1 Tax=Clostridium perfringens TaxID=1502 RepID=A0A2X3CJM3_CLOPF|nr:hypothetical protein [Clostridium perfringens]EJT6480979.1 hypothetical protein [Clostridium perfringens]EJT6531951.1 hypothetical protein [Clostridium perfringens]MBO3374894.1 hypothetical protein [Clostridium perfringens]NGU65311.1 hypothetical protein [Clostridium perfringens]SQC08705.1 Uncharacterised protein [Clostridium perfringens]
MKKYNSIKLLEYLDEKHIELLWDYFDKLNTSSGEIIIINLSKHEKNNFQKVNYYSTYNNNGKFFIKINKVIEGKILVLINNDSKIMILANEF